MKALTNLRPIASVVRVDRFAYLFILPSVILAVAVTVYPILYAIRFSFFESTILTPSKFVGLGNYLALIHPSILLNLITSFQFVFGSILLAVGLGLLIALILSQRVWLRTTARTIIFIPWVTSQLASALIWRWLVNPDYGPLVDIIRGVGFPRVDFLGDLRLAMLTLVLTNTWRSVAFSMIVLLAALQAIPESVSQAVQVDGPSPWRSFKDVTLPLIAPSLLLCIVISSLGYFNNIVFPLVLTGGGPVNATELISLRLYKEAFSYYHVGFASAIAILIFFVNLLLTLVYLRSLRSRAFY